jgi:hypothetical protein
VILSHRHRFIFLKTRKTAGTSIEIALSRFCGPDDVITPILDRDEATRRELGFPGPQNLDVPRARQRVADRVRALWSGPPRFYNHASAGFVRRYVEPEVWNGYFKFCFERNPYDKAISRWRWSTRRQASPPPLDVYLRNAGRRHLTNWDIYAKGGALAVDFVGRYEHLADDLAAALARIGLPADLALPRAKATSGSDARHYSELLDAPSRARIERVCARELAAFGYQWSDAPPAAAA